MVPLIAAEAAAAAALEVLDDVRSGCWGLDGDIWLAYIALAAFVASREAILG